MHRLYNKNGNELPTKEDLASNEYSSMMEIEFNLKLNTSGKMKGVCKEVKPKNKYIIAVADFIEPKTITGGK